MILPLELHVRVSLSESGWRLNFDSLSVLKVKAENPRLDIRIVPTTIPEGWRSNHGGQHDAADLATIASTQAQDLNSLLLHSNKDWHACINSGFIGQVYIEMEIGLTRVQIIFIGVLDYRDWPRTQRGFEEWRISHGLQTPASHSHSIDFTFLHYG